MFPVGHLVAAILPPRGNDEVCRATDGRSSAPSIIHPLNSTLKSQLSTRFDSIITITAHRHHEHEDHRPSTTTINSPWPIISPCDDDEMISTQITSQARTLATFGRVESCGCRTQHTTSLHNQDMSSTVLFTPSTNGVISVVMINSAII